MQEPSHEGRVPAPRVPGPPPTREIKLELPLRILFIDPDDRFRPLHERVFRDPKAKGINDDIIYVSSLEEGRKALREKARKGEEPFNLVVTEYYYDEGRQNGVRFAREVRDTLGFGKPTVVILTSSMHELRNDYTESQRRGEGVAMEIAKPLDIQKWREVRERVKETSAA